MKYRREIDGLRAVAVLPVIFFHAGFKAFSGGFIGVDVFFVISGYLITNIILSDMDKGKFSIITFYERRARRILPALFFVMFCCLPFAWLWLLPSHLKEFSKSLIAVSVFSSNILFWSESGYFATLAELKPLLHTWSLAVEEQYYVLFPLFLMALWQLRKRWILGSFIFVSIVSLLVAQWGAYNYPSATFYLLYSRGWELAMGAIIAFYSLYRKEHLQFVTSQKETSEVFGFIGLGLICYSIFAFDRSTPFPSLYALIPTIGTALIIIFSTSETAVGRFLGTKPMVGIGLISYSTYLWHQPLFVFARHRNITELSTTLLLVLSASSLLLAYLSWRFVEAPFRNKSIVSRKQLFSFAVIGSVAFAAIGLAGHFEDGWTSRLSKDVSEITHTSEDFSNVIGSLDEVITIGNMQNIKGVLIGDSHAESIAQTLGEELKEKNLGLRVFTKTGCPPVKGLFRFDIPSYGAKCDEHYDSVYNQIYENKSLEVVVISARYTLYLETDRFDNGEGGVEVGRTTQVIYDGLEYKNKLRSFGERKEYISKRFVNDIQSLVEAGKKVILVYPIPEVGWDVPAYSAKRGVFSSDLALSTPYPMFVDRNSFTFSVLDSLGVHDNLIRIYPHEKLCDTYVSNRCVAIRGSKSLYRDSNHLSNFGARYIVKDIADSL